MRKIKKVAITMRTVETKEYVELRDALSHDWVVYLESCGYIPLLIPSRLKDVETYVKELGCEALILGNGENVELKKNSSGKWAGSARDITEAKLLDWAIANKKPVLGVCRGMQLINCYFGGKLEGEIDGHVTKSHTVTITMDYFKEFYGSDKLEVNSYHRCAVKENHLGAGLLAWAVKDDIIEGFIHETHPILGIEWHPERQKPMSEHDRLLIEKFFNSDLRIADSIKK